MLTEHIIVAFQINDHDDPRKNIRHITTDELREFQTVSRVGFPDKVVPSPSVFVGTEHQVYDRSQRKNVVGYEEIFQVHNVRSGAKRLEIREYTESEDTRKTEYRDQNNVDRNRFFSAEMEQIHAEGHDIFKYADDRGEGGEKQEEKEQ